jgi:Periplasmic copper-binding protein (NosD)
MVPPEGAKGFANNFQNRNVTIQDNRIDNSFIYRIFVGNADGVKIIDNVVGQTFIRGSFDAGQFYGAKPDSGIFIGGSKNAEIANNKVARGGIVKVAVAVDRTCVKDSIHLANNVLA